MPEQVEPQRKTGQRGLLIASYKRLEKTLSDRAVTPAAEAVCVPEHLALPGFLQAKQLLHLHTQLSLGQSCHRQKKKKKKKERKKKKSLVFMQAGLVWSCPTLCGPVDCGLPGFSVRGFSRQEYWSILANTGCHPLLKHYISCCPSRQPP